MLEKCRLDATEGGKEEKRLIKKFSAQQKRIIENLLSFQWTWKIQNAYQNNEQIYWQTWSKKSVQSKSKCSAFEKFYPVYDHGQNDLIFFPNFYLKTLITL